MVFNKIALTAKYVLFVKIINVFLISYEQISEFITKQCLSVNSQVIKYLFCQQNLISLKRECNNLITTLKHEVVIKFIKEKWDENSHNFKLYKWNGCFRLTS